MSSVQIRDVRKSFGGFEVLHGVTIPIDLSTPRRKCSRLAVMPFTHFKASVRHPARRWLTLLNRLCAMIGSNALSCN